jgi:hypothetical protein
VPGRMDHVAHATTGAPSSKQAQCPRALRTARNASSTSLATSDLSNTSSMPLGPPVLILFDAINFHLNGAVVLFSGVRAVPIEG